MGEIHHNNSFPHFAVFDRLNGLSEESNSENMKSLTLSAAIFFFHLFILTISTSIFHIPPSPHL